MAMLALGFEPKKEEIKKMIADIDKVRAQVRGSEKGELRACFEGRQAIPSSRGPARSRGGSINAAWLTHSFV